MINSVYGKTMENSVKIVNNEKDFLKHVSKPTFIKWKIFDNCYATIHEIKTVLTLKKPIYVRFTVLELSKLLMYDFHHNFIKKHFDAELFFIDRDSITYEIKSEDVYEEFLSTNKTLAIFQKILSFMIIKMKDEFKRIPIIKFFRLKSNMNCILSDDDKESNTAKGVNTAVELKEYEDTFLNKKVIRHKMKRIQSKKHKITTYEINKMLLSCFDDKRFILDDVIHTLAYFLKDLRK